MTKAGFADLRSRSALAATWLLAATLLSPAVALAQNAQGSAAGSPEQAAQPAQVPANAPASRSGSLFPAQPPPAESSGGFTYVFGRWWDDTRGKPGGLSTPPNGTGNAASAPGHEAATATQNLLKGAAQATKDAATALLRLPGMRVVEVHQACAIAPNGAPDCRSAAMNVCRAKGFTDGHPVNVQSSENCPPAVWMSGRHPTAGECPEETVVLMVACQ